MKEKGAQMLGSHIMAWWMLNACTYEPNADAAMHMSNGSRCSQHASADVDAIEMIACRLMHSWMITQAGRPRWKCSRAACILTLEPSCQPINLVAGRGPSPFLLCAELDACLSRPALEASMGKSAPKVEMLDAIQHAAALPLPHNCGLVPIPVPIWLVSMGFGSCLDVY